MDHRLHRTMTVASPPEEVFAQLRTVTGTATGDPGAVRTTRLDGDGDVGTHYRSVSRFLGEETALTYVVEAAESPRLLALRGEGDDVVSRDTVTLTPTEGGGTRVTYDVVVEYDGAAPAMAPLLSRALRQLGARAPVRHAC